MARLNSLLRGFFSTIPLLFYYGIVYLIPCCLISVSAWALGQGKQWQAVLSALFAGGVLGVRIREQQRGDAGLRPAPTPLDWGAFGSYLRRALREEAKAMGGVGLVGQVTSKDDMGVIPPPEMFLRLREIDEDAPKRVVDRAIVLQQQEHEEG